MPNQFAQRLLASIAHPQARTNEDDDGSLRAEARSWAHERAKKLEQEVMTTAFDPQIYLLDVISDLRLTDQEKLKIEALGEILGIDLLRKGCGAQTVYVRESQNGPPKGSKFSIRLTDLQRMLAAS